MSIARITLPVLCFKGGTLKLIRSGCFVLLMKQRQGPGKLRLHPPHPPNRPTLPYPRCQHLSSPAHSLRHPAFPWSRPPQFRPRHPPPFTPHLPYDRELHPIRPRSPELQVPRPRRPGRALPGEMEELGMVLQRSEDVTEGTSRGLEGRRDQVFTLHVSPGHRFRSFESPARRVTAHVHRI